MLNFEMGFNEESFLSQGYISELLTSGMWTPHGSDIDEFVREYTAELGMVASENWQEEPTVINAFKGWLPKRYRYASRELYAELTKNTVSPHHYEIHRCIRGTLETFRRCESESFDIGKYWSTKIPSPYGAVDDLLLPVEIIVTGTVNHADIDWVETMRSRMDFNNGDIEAEIQLLSGKYPAFKTITMKILELNRE